METPSDNLGLALSGGGFRAAFFHIGVLAWMAENRILRRVRVISTVSGGSIVGALYYLHVRDLLQTKLDDEVADEDYLRIVRRLETTFLRGVETNIRGRGFSNLLRNLQMASAKYSRTNRIGQLYDKTFYRPAWNEPLFGPRPDARSSMIEVRELKIQPAGEPDDFNPMTGNEGRKAPVPILVLNATTLNTGHNWRFEAVGMGEPDMAPQAADGAAANDPREDARREIDRNNRLRWTRYDDLPGEFAAFALGYAVAASSCVPSLFQPIPITGLFEDFSVELVDGGVHDNQGIESLIEFDCSPIVVSDASGYLPDDAHPSTRVPAVAGRSLSIYGDRVREEQLIDARLNDASRPFGLVHLRKGITGYAFSPKRPHDDPIPPRPEPPPDFAGEQFPIAPAVQDYLSKMRTDLDAFSEVEAYSLMYDGYAMAGPNLGVLGATAPVLTTAPAWGFRSVEAAAAAGTDERYVRHLRQANQRFGKPFVLSGPAQLVGALLLALVGFALYELPLNESFGFMSGQVSLWWLPALAGIVAVLGFLYANAKLWKPVRLFVSDPIFTRLVPVVLAPILWVAALLLLLFSRLFLWSGRLRRVLR